MLILMQNLSNFLPLAWKLHNPYCLTEGLRKILPEEKDFPIAFVHLIHDDVGIFEMFLAVMYRPQNFHCVHIDSKVNFSILPK